MPVRSSDGLSSRQEKILGYIQHFFEEHGYSPSIRDIQKQLKISSTSVVAYNLNVLRDKGRLNRDEKVSRAITLPATTVSRVGPRGTLVPMLGTISAGSGIPNPEEINPESAEQIEVPADLAGSDKLRDVYALRVKGTSMIDALIDDGDIVLLRFQETAENGQMVAARLIDENTVTLKKFYHEGTTVRLQPANSTMAPIYTVPSNIRIEGRVVGVLRTMA